MNGPGEDPTHGHVPHASSSRSKRERQLRPHDLGLREPGCRVVVLLRFSRRVIEHGEIRRTIDVGIDEARGQLEALQRMGIDLKAITDHLEDAGIASFAKSFDTLLKGIDSKRERARREAGGGSPRAMEG
jgi:Transaldolase/Fructose-6-phosphate aldolase